MKGDEESKIFKKKDGELRRDQKDSISSEKDQARGKGSNKQDAQRGKSKDKPALNPNKDKTKAKK